MCTLPVESGSDSIAPMVMNFPGAEPSRNCTNFVVFAYIQATQVIFDTTRWPLG